MARLKVENHARRYLAAFLGLAFLTAAIRQPEAGWQAAAIAIGGWAIVLATIYRRALDDRRSPRDDEGASLRQVMPTLVVAVFWLFGWFLGIMALGLAWKYKNALAKAPERVRQSRTFATLFSLVNAVSTQDGDSENRRTASVDLSALLSVERQATKGDPWEALEAAEKEAKKAVVREVEAAPQTPASAAEPPVTAPAFVETVVAAAEAPALPPLPDLFTRSATEPVRSYAAGTDPLGEFKNPSSGFDEVLAMLQGKPSSSRKDVNR